MKKQLVKKSNFVQDRFYEKGNIGLKIRETAVSLFLWALLIFPLLVSINSIPQEPIVSWIYHWNYLQGREFTKFLAIVFTAGLLLIIVISLSLLSRNNYFEQKGFFKQRFYEAEKCKIREETLNEFYSQRFGSEEFRENIQSYVVVPEKNLDNDFSEKEFAKKGVSIPK